MDGVFSTVVYEYTQYLNTLSTLAYFPASIIRVGDTCYMGKHSGGDVLPGDMKVRDVYRFARKVPLVLKEHTIPATSGLLFLLWGKGQCSTRLYCIVPPGAYLTQKHLGGDTPAVSLAPLWGDGHEERTFIRVLSSPFFTPRL